MSRTKSTEVVSLSHRAFAAWWLLIFVVQVVTCFYNAIYSYYYWILQDAHLNVILESFVIGMPPPYHHTIAITHEIMSALHASDRTDSSVQEGFTNMYYNNSDPYGLFGVSGKHFHEINLIREIIEIILQTIQAYRMSMLLPRTLLNRFYVVLVAVQKKP
ncbi:hypothetical protein JG687_00008416 [Phytophthora cactorum]|uniref:Uncharacterized protein n=1 Tax=Phytophthora cactorum TaxID=29920 RepID=A0A8T1UCE6_9STRA|nr:hypothetical protein JG687_00008416 [Phytophthora cactorum]